MIELCALASGSNGNCYYIGTENEAILVDVGVSRKQVMLRMEERGLDPKKIKGIFISHEHADHTRGIKVLAKSLKVPVYMTKGTFENTWNPNRPGLYGIFEAGQSFIFGEFVIHPFLKKHDAANPCSFRVDVQGKSIGVMTDIGEVCENVSYHFSQCDAVFLESNYDDKMLREGNYPYSLKQRVLSNVGHLSNDQALELVEKHAGQSLTHLLLSHLSGENNTSEIVYNTFKHLEKKYLLTVTSRTEASELIVL